MLEILLAEAKELDNHGKTTREYFELFRDMVVAYLGGEEAAGADKDVEIVARLVQQATDSLKSHESSETRHSIPIDHTLQGLLELLHTTLAAARKRPALKAQVLDKVRETKLLDELLYQCLFYQEGKSAPVQRADGATAQASSKCGTSESRKSGFRVLQEYLTCLEPHEMAEFLEEAVMPLIKEVERPKRWRHSPSSKGRVHQHVGIVNLGCICYMISMLQQFFMVPQFRYQLLKAVDPSAEAWVEYKGEQVDDSLLRQLQRLFGFLQLSERHAFDPRDLCFAFKDWDGSPTPVGDQRDSEEFLHIFFDRIETLLKPTSQRDLLGDVFAGNRCWQLICQSCGAVKNRLELFYNLSLPVTGRSGVYDSLAQMVKGQTIEDYSCEACGIKASVTQRALLADVPNTLIVHLQRIGYSFDTGGREKVNTRFEFPNVLDLKDFSFKHT